MPYAAPGRTLAACLVLAALSAGAQPMYRWVDEKGVTHFSQDPPPDGRQASKIEPKVTPPSSKAGAGPRDNAEAWKERDAEFRARQLDRAQQEQAVERESTRRARRCIELRRRLAILEEPGRVYLRDDDGKRVYLEDSKRDSVIAEQRATVRQHCD